MCLRPKVSWSFKVTFFLRGQPDASALVLHFSKDSKGIRTRVVSIKFKCCLVQPTKLNCRGWPGLWRWGGARWTCSWRGPALEQPRSQSSSETSRWRYPKAPARNFFWSTTAFNPTQLHLRIRRVRLIFTVLAQCSIAEIRTQGRWLWSASAPSVLCSPATGMMWKSVVLLDSLHKDFPTSALIQRYPPDEDCSN